MRFRLHAKSDGSGFTASPGAAPTLSDPVSRRLPRATRRRRPALAGLALLLIVFGASATIALMLHSSARVSAIRITKQVSAGQPLSQAGMEEVRIAGTGINYLPWGQRALYAGRLARVTLLPGTLLTKRMTTMPSEELVPGKARVGLALKPGNFPEGLKRGRRVQIVYVPIDVSDYEHDVLAENALIHSVDEKVKQGLPGQVSVIVDASASPVIASHASNGRIALVDLLDVR